MTGLEHRNPGLAAAALTRDDVYVELIADGQHVHPSLWPIVWRTKPAGRLMLVSDALALAGMGEGRMTIGGLEVDVRGDRCILADGSGTLAGSVIALDTAVRTSCGRARRSLPRVPRRAPTRWRCWASQTGAGSPWTSAQTWSSSMLS